MSLPIINKINHPASRTPAIFTPNAIQDLINFNLNTFTVESESGGVPTGIITGTGSTNTIAMFTGTEVIGNSHISQNANNVFISEELEMGADIDLLDEGYKLIGGTADTGLSITNTGGGIFDDGLFINGSDEVPTMTYVDNGLATKVGFSDSGTITGTWKVDTDTQFQFGLPGNTFMMFDSTDSNNLRLSIESGTDFIIEDGTGNHLAEFDYQGAVTLYHRGGGSPGKKFETTNAGATVTGDLTVTGSFTGNAATATKWATGVTVTLSGDVTAGPFELDGNEGSMDLSCTVDGTQHTHTQYVQTTGDEMTATLSFSAAATGAFISSKYTGGTTTGIYMDNGRPALTRTAAWLYLNGGSSYTSGTYTPAHLGVGGTISAGTSTDVGINLYSYTTGTAAQEMLRLRAGTTSSNGSPFLSFYSSTTRKGYIQWSSSTIGMLILSESGPITAVGSGDSSLVLYDQTASGNPYIQWNQTGTRRAYIQYVNGGVFRINAEYGEIQFYAGGTHEATLQTDGDWHTDGDVIAYSTSV